MLSLASLFSLSRSLPFSLSSAALVELLDDFKIRQIFHFVFWPDEMKWNQSKAQFAPTSSTDSIKCPSCQSCRLQTLIENFGQLAIYLPVLAFFFLFLPQLFLCNKRTSLSIRSSKKEAKLKSFAPKSIKSLKNCHFLIMLITYLVNLDLNLRID